MINPFEEIATRLSRIEDILLASHGQNSNAQQLLPVDRPLSIDQAAEYTGLAKPTLYQMASQGRIPSHKRGKRLIFLESELLQWIKDGRKKQRA